MRAVFLTFCVAGVLASVVSATPLSREKRFAIGFAGFPFGGSYAATGVGLGPQFYNPAGFGFGPQLYPAPAVETSRPSASQPTPGFPWNFMMVPFPQIPMPVFPVIKNWYEGENVCKEEKVMNAQLPSDSIPDSWKEDMPNVSTDFSHEQESCKGTDKKYVCVKRIMDNGEAKVVATKYECCHGFVRSPDGCVENKQPGATQGGNKKLTETDPSYYYVGSSGSSSSRMSAGSKLHRRISIRFPFSNLG